MSSSAGIPTLLHMVRCEGDDKREAALAVLRDLAMAPEHIPAIIHYGGIPTMVDVISSGGSVQAAAHAASCLRSLALHEQYAREVSLSPFCTY